MYLDYSKLKRDSFGRPEVPDLELQTLDGRSIGIIPYASKLNFHIKFSELSEMEFEIPRKTEGALNPLYDSVSGYKLISTQTYGVYVVMDPVEESDGISETKTVTCYSREKLLDTKRFYISEGTYNFYNPASPADTLLGMIMECAVGWKVGYVSPSLWGRYRTFDDYDDNLLSFMYGTANEKYRCVFVFDTYEMTVNVYDADEERPALPIYLDFDNLVQNVKVNEISDELITAMRPYGADELDIRSVNPIGTNWIYDLTYFIENGSIETELADKWKAWQTAIDENRSHYTGLIGMQASTNAQLLTERAKSVDLESELTDLKNQQSVNIQQQARYPNDDDIAALVTKSYTDISAKNAEIAAQEGVISNLEALVDSETVGSYGYQIQQIVNKLKFTAYFSEDEQEALSHYFVEQDLTEETFVATNLDTSVSGKSYTLSGNTVAVETSDITVVDVKVGDEVVGQVYDIKGGTFSLSGDNGLSCNIVRGTLDANADGTCVMSLYTEKVIGASDADNYAAATGVTLTLSGTYTGLESETSEQTVDTGLDDVVYEITASSVQFTVSAGTMYVTAEANEYKKYLVQLELLDFATLALAEAATPTYEFSVDSGNFIFAKEFEPFKDKMELGKGIYLRLSPDLVISPIAIEMDLDFEDQADFSLVFSNRFKRHDNVATLKDMLEKSYSTSRSIDTSKYIYGQAANQVSNVTKFLNSSLDAAVNTIKSSANQSVTIDGAGIHLAGDGKYQMRLVDKMIAMTDDGWQSAKLAIGLFSGDEIGEYWGVNADVIGGKLLVGNNLIIENSTDDGVMQFRVDASGAWLNNASFVMQGSGGQLMIDPTYGVVAGPSDIYTTEGTTIIPAFLDENGKIVFEDDDDDTQPHVPKGANFYMDPTDGSVYLRGTIYATDGVFSGKLSAATGTFSGELSAATGTFSGELSAAKGTFSGELLAASGTFSGKITASEISGGTISGAAITGGSLGIGGVNNDQFVVTSEGNVTMQGSINLSKGKITWGSNSPVKYQYATTLEAQDPPADDADKVDGIEYWHDIMESGDRYRRDSYNNGETWGAGYQIAAEDGNSAIYQYSAIGGKDAEDWTTDYFVEAVYRRDSTDGGQTWVPEDGYKFVGTDANVNYDNIITALKEAHGLKTTVISVDSVGSPNIYGGNIYGGNIYAGADTEGNYDTTTFAKMTGDGFYVYQYDAATPKVSIMSLETGTLNTSDDELYVGDVQIALGAGSDKWGENGRFYIQKSCRETKDDNGSSTGKFINNASIIYLTTASKETGFTFNNDATITMHGTFDAATAQAIATAIVSDADALQTLSDNLAPVAVFGRE